MSKNTQDFKDNDKQDLIQTAINIIDKKYGAGSIMKLGEGKAIDVDVISSGSLNLDYALGIQGLPRGRIIEMYGQESSGKTTMALHAIAEAQKKGGKCAFIDVEHALDTKYASQIGVNIPDLLISQPDYAEAALDICETLIRTQAVDVVVLDSVAALAPKAEVTGEMGDVLPGLQARLMSQALRKITGAISKSNAILIFINQTRMKIGMGMPVFGNPETTSGGNALKFFASIRLEIKRVGSIKNKDELVGNKLMVRVVKNKLAPPFKVAEFEILYGQGVSRIHEVIDLAIKYDIINKKGSWFYYKDASIGQGKDTVVSFIEDDPKAKKEIYNAVVEHMSNKTTKSSSATETPSS